MLVVANGNLGNIPVLLLCPFGLILCCVKGPATIVVFVGYRVIQFIYKLNFSILLLSKSGIMKAKSASESDQKQR